VLEAAILASWPRVAVTDDNRRHVQRLIANVRAAATAEESRGKEMLEAQRETMSARLTRLTDAFVDGTIEKDVFTERRADLLAKRVAIEERLRGPAISPERIGTYLAELLELASIAQQSYAVANLEERRSLVQMLSTNLNVAGKNVVVEPLLPICMLLDRQPVTSGAPHRDATRTVEEHAKRLWEWAEGELARQELLGTSLPKVA
jgi:hypothetical protein